MTDKETWEFHARCLASARERAKWEPTGPLHHPLSRDIISLIQKKPESVVRGDRSTEMVWVGGGSKISLTLVPRTNEEYQAVILKADGLEPQKILCPQTYKAAEYWATTWLIQLGDETEKRYIDILKRAVESDPETAKAFVRVAGEMVQESSLTPQQP